MSTYKVCNGKHRFADGTIVEPDQIVKLSKEQEADVKKFPDKFQAVAATASGSNEASRKEVK